MSELLDNEAAKPNPALQSLAGLIGTWTTIGTHPLVPGTTFHGRTSFVWIAGGAFLLMESRIDEPEIPSWGGVLTKPMIDQMAAYAKKIFPTLPMGITHGSNGFKWRSGERYKVLDWVGVQYVYNYNNGNVAGWRSEVLNFAQANHVTPVFALNILNGGVRDRSGAWTWEVVGLLR